MKIEFVKPTLEHKKEAMEFKKSFLDAGEKVINGSEMLDCMESYEEWLAHITMNASAETVNPDWVVTDTFFVLDKNRKIVGIVDFRHELKGFLVDFGHCGYSVRPEERNRGYATEILGDIIKIAKEQGLDSINISVERSNVPSVKTIIKNGGKYKRSFEFQGEFADVYEISL